jgi:hypothetical protein
MRSSLFTALAIVIFLRFCEIKQLQHFQIATWGKYNTAHHTADSLSSLHAHNSTIQDFTINNAAYYPSLKQCAGKECKRAPHIKAHNKTSSEAAELTLEYIAVQLPRSHSFE